MSSVVPSPQRPGQRSATVIDLTEVRNDTGVAARKGAELPPPTMPPRRQRLIERMAVEGADGPDQGADAFQVAEARDGVAETGRGSEGNLADPADPVMFAKRLAGLIAEQRVLIERLADRSAPVAPVIEPAVVTAPRPPPTTLSPVEPAEPVIAPLPVPPALPMEAPPLPPPQPPGMAAVALPPPVVPMAAPQPPAPFLPAAVDLARALDELAPPRHAVPMATGVRGGDGRDHDLDEAVGPFAEEERPPMIIERAYAEAANGPPARPAEPSAVPGLLAGLALALCGGVGLYVYLLPGG